MPCKAWTSALLVGLVAVVSLLCAPTAGFAASEPAGLLVPGVGYASPQGSQPVRDVQRILRRLGDEPGPIDGLYGPLTAGAVQRFQEAHSLAVDGVVGPQTMGRLVVERGRLRAAKRERKSPARSDRAESVPEPQQARAAGNPQPQGAEPESSTGPSPALAAIVGGLALALLLVVLWRLARRRREGPRGQATAGPRLGLVCAALLAAYVVGAATGAVFATHATPDSGAKPSTATAEPRSR